MDKVILIFVALGFTFLIGCNSKPDFKAEIKKIDSLEAEVNKSLRECKTVDTSWVDPMTKTSSNNANLISQFFIPDTLIPEELNAITYYKGFRKVGKNFIKQRQILIKGFKKTLLQLKDLKTDAENGSLKKEDLDKYILEEETVTTELILMFNDLKYTTKEILKNYDSLNPKVEKIIEVYRVRYEKSKHKKKGKSGITLY